MVDVGIDVPRFPVDYGRRTYFYLAALYADYHS